VFKVLPDSLGFRIYEEYKTGVGALVLDSSGKLRMKFHSSKLDVSALRLYRKTYSPISYLSGDVMTYYDTGLTTQGPYFPTREELYILLPCHYSEANNPEYLKNISEIDRHIHPLTLSADVAAEFDDLYIDKNGEVWFQWHVTLPDAPEGKAVFTYRANVANVCSHTWAAEMVIAQEPDCTNPGYKYYPCQSEKCVCYKEMVEIPPLGHDFDTITSETQASCTRYGKRTGHCARCNKNVTETFAAPLGHDFVYHAAQSPTCTQQGWEAYYQCTRCHRYFNMDHMDMNIDTPPYVSAFGHSWGNETYSLTGGGSTLTTVYTCAVCGQTNTVETALAGGGSADSPWLIGSGDLWDLFTSVVGNGLDTSGMHFRLTNDITVSSMMGTSDNPFRGNVDGDGHTITINLVASSSGKGLFAFVSGASFEHLRVAGIITTNLIDTCGLIGLNAGGCTITDCVSSVEVHVTNSASGQAGFVGSSDSCVPYFYGSLFNGSITGVARYSAGFAGIGNCVFVEEAGD